MSNFSVALEMSKQGYWFALPEMIEQGFHIEKCIVIVPNLNNNDENESIQIDALIKCSDDFNSKNLWFPTNNELFSEEYIIITKEGVVVEIEIEMDDKIPNPQLNTSYCGKKPCSDNITACSCGCDDCKIPNITLGEKVDITDLSQSITIQESDD